MFSGHRNMCYSLLKCPNKEVRKKVSNVYHTSIHCSIYRQAFKTIFALLALNLGQYVSYMLAFLKVSQIIQRGKCISATKSMHMHRCAMEKKKRQGARITRVKQLHYNGSRSIVLAYMYAYNVHEISTTTSQRAAFQIIVGYSARILRASDFLSGRGFSYKISEWT